MLTDEVSTVDLNELAGASKQNANWQRSILHAVWHLSKFDGSPDDIRHLAELGDFLLDRADALAKRATL